jgi:hypothetical protein
VKRASIYAAVALIVANAATGELTTQSAGPRNLAPVLLVLVYLTAARRSWLAWLLLETITGTLGIVCALGTVSPTTVAGVLALATTAVVFPLEPGRRQPDRTDRLSSDGGLKIDVIAVNPGHD